MKVYVVWSPKYEWFELYSCQPKWFEELKCWGGEGLLRVVSGSMLPVSVAHEAKVCRRAVPCYAEIEVKYEFIR